MTTKTFVYDSGALIAIDKRHPQAVTKHEARLARGNRILVPAPVAAQVVRQPSRQARLVLTLRGCAIVPFQKEHVFPVGTLLAEAGTSDVVDGFVVLTAAKAELPVVVTSDADDIRRLVDALGMRIPVLEP
jgi:hypothetical protein